jgi:hypothetical protein
MDKRTIGIAVIVVALVVAFTGIASAAPAGDSEYTQDFGTPVTNASEGASNAARGGNITQANFTGVASQTAKWQGYYGNLSGSVTLGSSTGTMKSWGWSNESNIGYVLATPGWSNESNIGYVLATPNSSIPDWSNYTVVSSNGDIDTVYQFNTNDVDSADKTFDDTPVSTAVVVAGTSHTASNENTVLTWNADASADKWQTTALDYGSPTAGQTQLMMFVGVNNATAAASAYNDILCDWWINTELLLLHRAEVTGVEAETLGVFRLPLLFFHRQSISIATTT